MKEIYVVFEGEYSERDALAAFTKKADAERAVANGFGSDVQAIAVDPMLPDLPDGKHFWAVYFRPGNSPHASDSQWPYSRDAEGNYSLAIEECNRYDEGGGRVLCWAANDIDAIAIARQRLIDRGALAAS